MTKEIIQYTWALVSLLIAIGVVILLARVSYKVVKDPEMKWYKRLKWHLKEINKTLSNEPSHYSSKRVERMLLFLNANIMLDIITYQLLMANKLAPLEAVTIYGAQMLYAGFQTKQIFKEAKKDEQKG